MLSLTETIATASLWAYLNGVELDFNRPGKPTDNAFIEAFNGPFRQECLNENWFLSLEDAQEKIGTWRKHYNGDRPHGALNNLAPLEFAAAKMTAEPAKLTLQVVHYLGVGHFPFYINAVGHVLNQQGQSYSSQPSLVSIFCI